MNLFVIELIATSFSGGMIYFLRGKETSMYKRLIFAFCGMLLGLVVGLSYEEKAWMGILISVFVSALLVTFVGEALDLIDNKKSSLVLSILRVIVGNRVGGQTIELSGDDRPIRGKRLSEGEDVGEMEEDTLPKSQVKSPSVLDGSKDVK